MRHRFVALATALLLAPPAAHADWQAGVQAFRAGNYAQAIQEFQTVLAEQPDWVDGHLTLGQALLKANRPAEAVDSFRRAHDLAPGPVPALLLGQAYVTAGRHADGASILSKIDTSALSADQRAAHSQLLAKALAESGQSDAALDALARAAQAKPNDADVQYQYGVQAFNAGDTRAAIDALGRAAQLAPSAERHHALATALIRQGRESSSDEAKLAAYRRAAEVAGRAAAAEASYENLRLLGEAQLAAKQYDSAIASLRQASGKSPNDWLPHFYLGQALTQKEQYSSAVTELRQALQLAGSRAADQVTIWNQLGFVYEKQRSWEEAKTAYTRAGNNGAVARVQQNQQTAEYNASVEEENRLRQELQEEAEALRRQLEELPGTPTEEEEPPAP